MAEKNTTLVTDEFDFGFSIVDEDELPRVQLLTQQQEEVEQQAGHYEQRELELQMQLHKLYNSIIPLLRNLKGNPDKDYILWPNRTAKIDAFKQKIDAIVGDTVEYVDI